MYPCGICSFVEKTKEFKNVDVTKSYEIRNLIKCLTEKVMFMNK